MPGASVTDGPTRPTDRVDAHVIITCLSVS